MSSIIELFNWIIEIIELLKQVIVWQYFFENYKYLKFQNSRNKIRTSKGKEESKESSKEIKITWNFSTERKKTRKHYNKIFIYYFWAIVSSSLELSL